jgi:hypothetical protein
MALGKAKVGLTDENSHYTQNPSMSDIGILRQLTTVAQGLCRGQVGAFVLAA